MKRNIVFGNPKYKGKHLLLVEGKVVVSGNWKKVSSSLDKVYLQGKIPTLTYIPKADTLVLLQK
ncbi:hypothetical protein HZB69_01145 [Candidatus Amesbacteria bacterium]|nr:hypothetical protein [Candidatus Amesbacteria bacterium]